MRMAQHVTSVSGPTTVRTTLTRQEAILEACRNGKLDDLQNLLDDHAVKQEIIPSHDGREDERSTSTSENTPATWEMFTAAISEGHISIVRYLHSIYPMHDFETVSTVCALLKRADIEMLRLIHSYSPGILRINTLTHIDSPLSKACEGGPSNAPFIHFLLDHGANDGGFGSYMWHFGGALNAALHHDQPIEIIKKMAPNTDHLWLPTAIARDRKRYDVVELLLRTTRTRELRSMDVELAQQGLDDARTKEDKKLVALYTHHHKVVKDRHERAEKTKKAVESRAKGVNASHETPEGSQRTSWWWKPRTMPMSTTGEDGVDGQSSQTARSNDSRWWWPLWKRGRQPGSKEFPGPGKQVDDSSSSEENEEIS